MARRYSRAAGRSVAKEMRARKHTTRGRRRSRKQAIAIGLSKARRAGHKVPSR
jgi:hypothetical protein